MATRTQRKTVAFGHPFRLKGVDRVLPPGDYEVLTDEELIEGLSFPVTTAYPPQSSFRRNLTRHLLSRWW